MENYVKSFSDFINESIQDSGAVNENKFSLIATIMNYLDDFTKEYSKKSATYQDIENLVEKILASKNIKSQPRKADLEFIKQQMMSMWEVNNDSFGKWERDRIASMFLDYA